MAQNARTTTSPIHVWTGFCAQFNAPSSASIFEFNSLSPLPMFNATFFALRFYLFYFIRMQFISSFNQCISVIIPLLTAFLQLKYQGTNDQNSNPFATHPRAMRVAVSSSVVYYLAYIVLLRYPLRRFTVLAHRCLIWCGHASVASLASVLVPNWVSLFIYAVVVLMSLGDLLNSLYHKLVSEEGADQFQVYRRRGVCRFLNNIFGVVDSSSRPRSRPQILPI